MTDDAPADDAPATDTTPTAPVPPPPASEAAPEPEPAEPNMWKDDDPRRRIELVAAVLLGLAGILAAIAAFRAAQTGGDELLGLTQASEARGEANSYYAEYSNTYNADMQLFLDYEVKLFEDMRTPEADPIAPMLREQFFSENLEAATAAWSDDETGVATPLGMEEYETPDYNRYFEELDRAEERFSFAEKAAAAGDKFDGAAVFLALALFFAGIAALFKTRKIQVAGLIGSIVAMTPGIIWIVQGQGLAT